MKAWLVKDKDEFSATVVFAETRGKARALAMHTEVCEDVDFCNIQVKRKPQMDKYYTEGKKEMDWFDSKDRIALVSECGFQCEYVEPYMCQDCPAKDICEDYQEYLTEEEGAE